MKSSRTTITNQGSAIANKITDISFDLSKLNLKMTQCDTYHEEFDSLLKEEGKLRQNIEKKTFLMNESFNEQIKSLKTGFGSLTTTITDQIEEIKTKIFEDVQNSNSKVMKAFEANMLKFQDYEKTISSYEQNKHLDLCNFDKKMALLEEVFANQFNNLKSELRSTQEHSAILTKQLDLNTSMINESIKQTNIELNAIKGDIEMLKGFKIASSETFGKISDDIIYSNEQMSKCVNDISIAVKETETKMRNFENVFNRLNETFAGIKSDVYLQMDDMKVNHSRRLDKINEEVVGKMKQCKVEMEKFNINMIQENQKFIEYNQLQLQNQNGNMKKLYDYTNEDVDLLKKKCEGLEGITKTMRQEMLDNINSMEGFLTQRYDSIFRTLGSERSML